MAPAKERLKAAIISAKYSGLSFSVAVIFVIEVILSVINLKKKVDINILTKLRLLPAMLKIQADS